VTIRRLLCIVSTAALSVALVGLAAPAGAQTGPPHIAVNPATDMVSGWDLGTGVVVSIGDRQWSGERIEYEENGFALYLSWEFDVQPGQTVVATGSLGTASLTVADIEVTGYDIAANTVSGTTDQAEPDNLFVSASHADAYGETQVWHLNGSWAADFADTGYQLRISDSYEVCQPDAQYDETCVSGVLAGPRFTYGTEVQEVVGLDWPDGQLVTLTVERPVGNTVYTASMTPPLTEPYSMWLMTGNGGTVYFDLVGHVQVVAGDVLTMTNGTTTKQQVIPALTVALPDYEANSVSGSTSTSSGSFLTASSDAFWNGGQTHEVVPDGTGAWSTTFDEADITDQTMPFAYETDVDGDVTESHAPVPGIWVDPAADRIWAIDFAPGQVSLTITRSATTVHAETITTTNVLTHGSWNIDMWAQPTGTLSRPAVALHDGFDVQAGDVVTVSDSTSTRTVTVAYLTVDSISAATDTITGQRDTTSSVSLHLGEGEGGYWGYQIEPGTAQWSYTFTPGEFPNPPAGLEAGMTGQAIVYPGTLVRWVVPSATTAPADLIPDVHALGLRAGIERSLVSLLQAAQAAYDADRDTAGNRSMNGFINKVSALTPRTIPTSAAESLIDRAEQVIAAHT
jgi:hypothetical protein